MYIYIFVNERSNLIDSQGVGKLKLVDKIYKKKDEIDLIAEVQVVV